MANLADLAEKGSSSLFDAIPFVTGNRKAERALHAFHEWFSTLRFEIENMDVAQASESILDRSGYIQALENEDTMESRSRLDNIEELYRSMQEFMESSGKSVTEYLDRISLYSDMDTFDDESDAIVLMTIHNSKGLEFDNVFIVGLEEGIFSSPAFY